MRLGLRVQCGVQPKDPCSCVWPAQEIKKPLQLEAYLCVNYLGAADLNKSETRFSVRSVVTCVVSENFPFKCKSLLNQLTRGFNLMHIHFFNEFCSFLI